MSRRLLVSARSVEEATLAINAGVDILDLKEPDNGPLGSVSRAVMRRVLESVALAQSGVSLSCALGELMDWITPERPAALPKGFEFAKWGLSKRDKSTDWKLLWLAAAAKLPEGTKGVPVIYADGGLAAAPPDDVLRFTEEIGAPVVLIDTFHKNQGALFETWSRARLTQTIQRAHAFGAMVAVAGSLSLETIPQALAAGADIIGVRGAACRAGRSGALDSERIARLLECVRGKTTSSP